MQPAYPYSAHDASSTLKSADKELLVDHHDHYRAKAAEPVPLPHDCPPKNPGSGQFHIICPMDKYISGIRKHRDAISRRFNNRCISVLQEIIILPCSTACLFICLHLSAKHRIRHSSTASIICNWRCCSFDSHGVRQKTDRAGCNTRHLSTQPFLLWNCRPHSSFLSLYIVPSLKHLPNYYFISFWSVATSSSIVSSFPARISSATQVRI